MKIEEQVLSIEQMKHLQELGVDTSDASMCWLRYDVGGVVKQFVEINDIKITNGLMQRSILHTPLETLSISCLLVSVVIKNARY